MAEESIPLNSKFTLDFHKHNNNPPIPRLKEKFEKLLHLIQIGNVLELEVNLRKWKERVKQLCDFQNEEGRTLLHVAAEYLEHDCVRILLEVGANPNIADESRRSPLHSALDSGCHCERCSNKIIKCIEKLLDYGADVSAEDSNADNPLQLAAKNLLPKCALVLIDHGAFMKYSGHLDTGQLLVERMPEVFLRMLDRGISYDENDCSKLQLHFGWMMKNERDRWCNANQYSLERSSCLEYNEMFILSKLTQSSPMHRKAILTHPWLEAFLHLKWLAVRKWFWSIRCIYGCFLLFYSYFIFEVFVWRCPYSNYYGDGKNSSGSNNNAESETPEQICQTNLPSALLYGCAVVAVVCVSIMILNEIFEFKMDMKAYFTNYLNLLWWNLIISLIITMLPAFGMVPRPWQYPVAAFGLFYAWGMNFTQISRLPFFGDYIEMLGKVLTDFFFFVTTFISLIIAFTLSLCVMFPENEFFSNIPLAFVKILIIMIGEPDYEGLFKKNDRLDNFEYSIPAHVLYVAFIFIVTIVLMNLLLALAVNDIQELRKQSSIKRAIRQITQISMLETFINNVGIGTWLASHVLRTSSVEATIGRTFTFSPTNPSDTSFPEELKQKFVPYLTSSPCLKKHAHAKFSKIRTVLAPIRWKNYKCDDQGESDYDQGHGEDESNSFMVTPTTPSKESVMLSDRELEKERLRLMLKTIGDNLIEMKSQLEKLSSKIDRKL